MLNNAEIILNTAKTFELGINKKIGVNPKRVKNKNKKNNLANTK